MSGTCEVSDILFGEGTPPGPISTLPCWTDRGAYPGCWAPGYSMRQAVHPESPWHPQRAELFRGISPRQLDAQHSVAAAPERTD